MHELWSEQSQLCRLVFKSFWWMCCWMCKSVPSGTSSSWGNMYTPGFIANSQRTTTKINKNGAIAKVRISVELEINYKAFKTFRIISNEMPVLLLLLNWWYFSYLQMNSEKFFNVYFYEQIFFEISVTKGNTC